MLRKRIQIVLLAGLCCLPWGCNCRNGAIFIGGKAGPQPNFDETYGEGKGVYREIRFSADGTAVITFNSPQGLFVVQAVHKRPDQGLLQIDYRATEQQKQWYAEAVRAAPTAASRNAGRKFEWPQRPWADLPAELPETATFEVDASGVEHIGNRQLNFCTTAEPKDRGLLFSLNNLKDRLRRMGAGTAKEDTDKILGTWVVISMDGGDAEAFAKFEADSYIFSTGKMTKKSKDATKADVEGLCTLNTSRNSEAPNKNPREIDIDYFRPGPGCIKGIYMHDGDSLKMCFSGRREGLKDNEMARPTAFHGKAGQTLLILERQH